MSAPAPPELADVSVEGRLVRLRPVRPADAESVFPLLHGREAILRWLVWKGPVALEELEETYSAWVRRADVGANYLLAIEALVDGTVQGTLSLRFVDHPFVGDVGYWVAEGAWGRGYATEANLLAAHLALRHLEANALTAEVFEGNRASARVLEKVGYQQETSVEGRALDGPEVEIDRPKWLYGLTRRRFEDRWGDWRPAAGRIELRWREE